MIPYSPRLAFVVPGSCPVDTIGGWVGVQLGLIGLHVRLAAHWIPLHAATSWFLQMIVEAPNQERPAVTAGA